AYASRVRVKGNHLTDHHRLFENHLFDGDRNDFLAGQSRYFYGAGHVDVTKNNSTKNGAVFISVTRQQHDPNGWVPESNSGLVVGHLEPSEEIGAVGKHTDRNTPMRSPKAVAPLRNARLPSTLKSAASLGNGGI